MTTSDRNAQRAQQREPVLDLVRVLVSAGEDIRQQVCTAAEIVSDPSPRAGEISHDVTADVAPGIEGDIEVPGAQLPKKAIKSRFVVARRAVFPGKRSPRKIKGDDFVYKTTVQQQHFCRTLREHGDSRVGEGASQLLKQRSREYHIAKAPRLDYQKRSRGSGP